MRIAISLLGLCLCLPACGNDPPRREWRPSDHDPPNVEETGQVTGDGPDMNPRIVFARLCVRCHGPDGKGSTLPGGSKAADLTATRKTDPELLETILRGRGLMPRFDDQIAEADARNLVAFIRGL